MFVLKTKYQKLSRVAFAPDGRGLAAAGQFGAYWWASVFENPKGELVAAGDCNGVGFAAAGTHLLATLHAPFGQPAELIAVALADRSRQSAALPNAWTAVSVCPTTGLAVTESWLGGEMAGWVVGPAGAPVRVWKADAAAGSIGSAVAFGPGGAWFVRAARPAKLTGNYNLVVHDAATGAALRTLPAAEWVSCGPAASPDGEWIAFGFANVLRVQSATDPKRSKFARNDNTHQFTGLAFHPGGAVLAVTNNDKTVKLYDTTTWEVVRTFTWDIGKMRSVAFSPDGALAAAGSDSGKVVVWDVDL